MFLITAWFLSYELVTYKAIVPGIGNLGNTLNIRLKTEYDLSFINLFSILYCRSMAMTIKYPVSIGLVPTGTGFFYCFIILSFRLFIVAIISVVSLFGFLSG